MSDATGGTRIVVVTAVRAETRAVLAALVRPVRVPIAGSPRLAAWEGWAGMRAVTVVQAGIGPERARTAMRAAVGPGEIVASIGFAGALVDGAVPGDVVMPGTIIWEEEGTVRCYEVPAQTLAAAAAELPVELGQRALRGPLWSSPIVIDTPAAKRAGARRLGAVAVEMEAAALIAVAAERGGTILALRAILDTVDVALDALPPDLDVSWAARARLLGRPKAWPGAVTLARHLPRAARTLTRAAAAILPVL